jgi:hypothetical protein
MTAISPLCLAHWGARASKDFTGRLRERKSDVGLLKKREPLADQKDRGAKTPLLASRSSRREALFAYCILLFSR